MDTLLSFFSKHDFNISFQTDNPMTGESGFPQNIVFMDVRNDKVFVILPIPEDIEIESEPAFFVSLLSRAKDQLEKNNQCRKQTAIKNVL